MLRTNDCGSIDATGDAADARSASPSSRPAPVPGLRLCRPFTSFLVFHSTVVDVGKPGMTVAVRRYVRNSRLLAVSARRGEPLPTAGETRQSRRVRQTAMRRGECVARRRHIARLPYRCVHHPPLDPAPPHHFRLPCPDRTALRCHHRPRAHLRLLRHRGGAGRGAGADSGGTPALLLVGLPDKAVGEARERMRAALSAIGLSLPPRRVLINLAPADLLKEGSHFDLPITLACWRRWRWCRARTCAATRHSANCRWTAH